MGGRSFDKELQAWVHGTDDLPWHTLLGKAGVAWNQQAPSVAQRLGLRVSESALTGIKLSQVLRGGAAEAAGVSVGDELIAIDGWRIRRLDELTRVMSAKQPSQLLLSRDQRMLTLTLELPPVPDAGTVTLALAPADKTPQAAFALRRAWLST